jgi:cobalt transporter subunit CbtA
VSIFRAIVFSAVAAGLFVGLVITAVQHGGTVPLILKAEVYERAAEAAAPAAAAGEHSGHEHGAPAWEPQDGLERNLYTAGANVLTAIGFALLLGGLYALRRHPVSWREGALWGLAGFAVFTIAPGLGLPPELPGIPAAPLDARQLWWIATAGATAGGIALFVFRRSIIAAVLGFCLIVAPHLVGAPQLADVHTNVPELLSHQFAVAVTLTSFLFWVLLGSLTGLAYSRFSGGSRQSPAA